MSDGFVKLFSSLLESTVWMGQPPYVKLAWITLLAKADSTGKVTTPVPSLATLAGITLEEFEEALQVFLSPDKYSRSQEYEGRRIEPLEGERFSGYLILNHAKYRQERSAEARRRQLREAQARYRAKRHADGDDVIKNDDDCLRHQEVSHDKPRSAQAEAEAEAEAEADLPTSRRPSKAEEDPATCSVMAGGAGGAAPPGPPAEGGQAPLNPPQSARRGGDSKEPNGVDADQKRRPGKRDLPKDWAPNEAHQERAKRSRLDLDQEVGRFRDYYAAHGKRMADWDAAFRNWLIKAAEIRESHRSRGSGSRSHPEPQPLNDKPLDVERITIDARRPR